MKLSGRKKRRILIGFLTAVCLVLLLCAGCARGAIQKNLKQGGYMESWSADDGRVLSGLSYGTEKTNKYDLYLPKGVEPGKDAPLLLLIHGGSWTEGNRGDIAYACKYYAKHGCITATMDYSLVSKENDVTIKTMLDEITACIAAIQKKLKKEGYNAPKLAVGGLSAGGHLALLYAYSRASESAIPVDPEKLDAPETVAAADSLSPLHFVGPDSPPTIFAYGGRDDLVRPVHRDELAKALEAHHVPNVRVDFPNSNHAMWDDPDCTEAFRKAVLQYCETYMKPESPQVEPEQDAGQQAAKE